MLACLACVSALAFATGGNEGSVEEQKLEVYVGPYTPNIPASVGPELEVAQIIADEYEEQHPGVTIEFYAAPADDWATALKTALAGGTAPDITTVQITQFWTDINKGWFAPLDEHLAEPNPYVEGNQQWLDIFYPDLSMRYRAPDDLLYTIAIDLVDTGVFYNKKIFEEVGVAVPTTWAELMDVQERIAAHGEYLPFAYRVGILNDWTTTVIQETLQRDLLEQINLDGDNRVSLEEFARAYKQGLYLSSDPTMQEAFRIIKDWSQYWQDGWATAQGEDTTRLFATQQAAMMWDGSWAMRSMKYDPAINFDWGIFALPPITEETTPLATGYTIPSVGGIGTQLAITNSAIDGNKVDLAIDFLRYWTAPQNSGRLINEYAAYLPNVRGIEPSAEMAPFAAALENWKNYWWDGRIGSEVYGKMNDEIWVPYLLDRQTLEETTAKRDALLAGAVDEVIASQGWDF
jgi:ABC-type glycerol-3-phosphate transport system substrate-binding protein